jgi:hypothetical protein
VTGNGAVTGGVLAVDGRKAAVKTGLGKARLGKGEASRRRGSVMGQKVKMGERGEAEPATLYVSTVRRNTLGEAAGGMQHQSEDGNDQGWWER